MAAPTPHMLETPIVSEEPVITAAILFALMAAHGLLVATGFLAHFIEAQNRHMAPPPLSYARASTRSWR